MLSGFVAIWDQHKQELKQSFTEKHPADYATIVRLVVEMLNRHYDDNEYEKPSPERIHTIDDGDYQGMFVFLVGASSYQPTKYWYVKVDYGSCSGCDTLQRIQDYSSESPTEEQVNQYMTLALHIIQGFKELA